MPLSLALAVVGAKLATMWGFAAWGSEAYGDERYSSAESAYRRLGPLNVIDPSLAHVGIAVSLYRQGDLVGAEVAFADALGEAPDDCEIRFDLAVTIEAQGDRLLAGEPITPPPEGASFDAAVPPSDPTPRYRTALEVIEDGRCPSNAPDDAGERIIATRERVEAKLRALHDEVDDPDRPDPQANLGNDRGDSEQIDDVQLRNQAGARQREAARDADTRGVTPDGQSNW